MENKYNFKKLLCYNIVNNCKCVYKNKCMFAHTLEEQKKEPIRQYIYNMLYVWEDLSNININEDKTLLNELIIMTKECKNCINKKCPGGYNCKFGTCLKENKICYNDLYYGKCYNTTIESNQNEIILNRCINGIHLTEKKLIPYNQRILSDITNFETKSLLKNNIGFNLKNNIISILLNDNTIKYVKDIVSNKINKTELINNLKITNQLLIKSFSKNDNDLNEKDNIFDDIVEEYNLEKNYIDNEIELEMKIDNILNNNTDINKLKNIIIYDDDNSDKIFVNQTLKIQKYTENEENNKNEQVKIDIEVENENNKNNENNEKIKI